MEEVDDGMISLHHPFTAPTKGYKDLKTATSQAYDVVLNGTELGGGSIRINDIKLQKEVFDILGLTDEQVNDQFGFFIDAFKYGVPQHGGIALGIDRMISLMLNTKSIRDVIAFPKNSSGVGELEHTPSMLDEKQLEELRLKLK
jgi:aspartyl-tRNA synthetase